MKEVWKKIEGFDGYEVSNKGRFRRWHRWPNKKGEIDYLQAQARTNADYWALRLQNFCISYSQDLPQYLQSVGNQTQIYPDQTNQYFGGIQL